MDRETAAIIGSRSIMAVAAELVASGCIERALDLTFDDIPVDMQHELGALLLHSPEARRWVLQAWPLPEGRLYPGIALEPLIEAGDREAAEVYREYLPGSPYNWGLYRRSPPESVLGHPVVRPEARRLALEAIERACTPDHEGRRVSVTSAAVVLQNLAAAWHRDPLVTGRVWSLLDTDQPERLVAVLNATSRVELEVPRMDDLFARVRADLESVVSSLDNLDFQRAGLAEREVEWLEERGFVNACCTMIRRLGALRRPLGWTALAVLWPELSEAERVQASCTVAEDAMEARDDVLPLEYLRRFVRAAPEDWCDRLVATIDAGGAIVGTIGIQALTLFPRDLQVRVARALRGCQLSEMELPWRGYGRAGECARPADVVRRLLFELGE